MLRFTFGFLQGLLIAFVFLPVIIVAATLSALAKFR